MNNVVQIQLSGDAGALIAALKTAGDQFNMLRSTMTTTADAAKQFGLTFAQQAQAWLQSADRVDVYSAALRALQEQMQLQKTQQELATQSIRDYTTQMRLTQDTITTLAQAQAVLGDDFAQSSQAFLMAASSADDYAARLAMIGEQIQLVQAQVGQANALIGTQSAFGEGSGGMLGGIFGDLTGLGAFGDVLGPLGALAGGIGDVVSGMGDFIGQSVQFVAALATWTIIQDAISWVSQLSEEMFNLQVQTEKAGTGWSYLLGGGPTQQGVQQSHDLMQWLSTFSLTMPFTKQDAMSGATALISMGGANEGQTEALLPALADVAATYGSATHNGQGTSLAQAAYALAMFRTSGYSRMLKMDLGITPEMLVPYGLQGTPTATGMHVTDPNSVYAALINFANAKVPNAAQGIVGSTWWGGYSSLIDNIQNLLTEMGGTNMDGTIRSGSFFATIKTDLDGLLAWFTSHRDQLMQFATITSHLLGDVVSAGGGMLGQLAQWFEKLGGVGAIESGIEGLDATVRQWFGMDAPDASKIKSGPGGRQKLAQQIDAQSGPPEWFKELADAAQQLAGLSWQGIEAFMSGMEKDGPGIAQTVADLANDLDRLTTSMTPAEVKLMDDFFNAAGGALGIAASQTLEAINDFSLGWAAAMQAIAPLMPQINTDLDRFRQIMGVIATAILDWSSPIQLLAQTFDSLYQSIRALTGLQIPDWLRNGLNWIDNPLGLPLPGHSSGGSSGGGQAQTTRTPGGFRTFGQVGA